MIYTNGLSLAAVDYTVGCKQVGWKKNSFSMSWLVRSHSHLNLGDLTLTLTLTILHCLAYRETTSLHNLFLESHRLRAPIAITFTMWARLWRILRGRLAAVASDKRAPIIFNYFRAQMQSASGRYPLMSGRGLFLPHFNSAEKMRRCIWIINAHLHVDFQ